jgi:uncharacterized protein (TIGR02996 family)
MGAKKRAAKKPQPRRAPSSRSEELEAAVFADPHADAPRLVYADWLLSQGDPRGELAVVQHALRTARGAEWAKLKAQERTLFDTHAQALYGPLVRWRRARLTGLEWRDGFIDAIRGGDFQDSETLSGFLAHPSARFVQHVKGVDVAGRVPPALEALTTFRGVPNDVWAHRRLRALASNLSVPKFPRELVHDGLEELVVEEAANLLPVLPRAKLPQLKRFSLGVHGNHLGKLKTALADVKLEALTVNASAFLSPLALAELGETQQRVTTLAFRHDVNFARAHFPKVKKLVVGLGEGDGEVFQGLHEVLPALEEVDLQFPSDRVRFFRAFATSPVAKKVKRLRARVSKPAAGLALTEGTWDALEHLEVSFDSTFSLEYLQAEKLLAAKCWAKVKSLRLEPGVPAVVARAPLAKSLETLALVVDQTTGLAKALKPFPKLKTLVLDGPRQLAPEAFAELGTLEVELQWAPRV